MTASCLSQETQLPWEWTFQKPCMFIYHIKVTGAQDGHSLISVWEILRKEDTLRCGEKGREEFQVSLSLILLGRTDKSCPSYNLGQLQHQGRGGGNKKSTSFRHTLKEGDHNEVKPNLIPCCRHLAGEGKEELETTGLYRHTQHFVYFSRNKY